MAPSVFPQHPRAAVAAAQENAVRLTPFYQSRTSNARSPSWQSDERLCPLEDHGTAEIVDLTGSDEDVILERQAARDAPAKPTVASLDCGLTNGDGVSGTGVGVRPGDNRDSPILDDDDDDDRPDDGQPGDHLNTTASAEDDEQTLMATQPADRNGSHSSFSTNATEPSAIGSSVWSATVSPTSNASGDDPGDTEQEWPSVCRWYNRYWQYGEVAEADRDAPQLASAFAGSIYDVFTQDEKTSGESPMEQTPRKWQQRGRHSSRPTDHTHDAPLALTSASGGSDQITSRKRCAHTAGSLEGNPPSKRRCRSCRSGMSTQTAREAGETSARLGSQEEMLRYALRLPRYCRGTDWEVVDIDGIYLAEDGSLTCKLLWRPTMALVSSLTGALLERAEELVKKEYGADVWGTWLEKQDTMG